MGDVELLPAKDRLWRQHDSSYKNTTMVRKERSKRLKEGTDRREGMTVMDEGAINGGREEGEARSKKQER